MKFVYPIALAVVSFVGLGGCTKSEDTSLTAPPPPQQPAPAVVMSAPPSEAPAAVTPPPMTGQTASPATTPTEPEVGEFTTFGPDGKAVPALEFMNAALDGYNRTRAAQTEGEIWPPITSLDQLIQYRVISRMPAAPAGQKFVINPETGKVALTSK